MSIRHFIFSERWLTKHKFNKGRTMYPLKTSSENHEFQAALPIGTICSSGQSTEEFVGLAKQHVPKSKTTEQRKKSQSSCKWDLVNVFMCSFTFPVYLFSRYLVSSCYVPGIVIETRDCNMSQIWKVPSHMKYRGIWRRQTWIDSSH